MRYFQGYIRVVLGWKAIQLEYVQQIVKLSMNVPTNCKLVALCETEHIENLIVTLGDLGKYNG